MTKKRLSKMNLPLFYNTDISAGQQTVTLDEDTSKHVVNVLRMKKGQALNLTNGQGYLWLTEILDDHKKRCEVRVLKEEFTERTGRKTYIALSLLKNNSRLEWFLEKATELGIHTIIPLICD